MGLTVLLVYIQTQIYVCENVAITCKKSSPAPPPPPLFFLFFSVFTCLLPHAHVAPCLGMSCLDGMQNVRSSNQNWYKWKISVTVYCQSLKQKIETVVMVITNLKDLDMWQRWAALLSWDSLLGQAWLTVIITDSNEFWPELVKEKRQKTKKDPKKERKKGGGGGVLKMD